MEQYGGGYIDFADGKQVKKLRGTNSEHTQTKKVGKIYYGYFKKCWIF